MAEGRRPWEPAEDELEGALGHVGARLAYPPTPDLAGSVRGRLRVPPRRRLAWTSPFATRRGLSLALAALLVVAGAVLLLSSAARTAIAERLGLRGVAITYVPWLIPSTPTPVGTGLQLGERLSLPEAQARVPYRILTPGLNGLGAPDEVYVGTPPPGGQVALVYRARRGSPASVDNGVGLLLTQFRGDLAPELFAKLVGPETRVERVTVNGGLGLWIEGRPHLFLYRDRSGEVREESIRLVGNTLIWQQGELTLRLESAGTKDEAVRIASSVR